jgi:leucyl-tRNA synthetase
MHQTVNRVTGDVDALRYNTAISALMKYVNVLRSTGPDERQGGVSPELLEPAIIMLAPFAPHFSEECWEALGCEDSVLDASWPTYDPELARVEEIELVVQVNGRVRGRVSVAPGLSQDEAVERAVAEESVKRFVNGEEIRKIVFVPDRLVNLVV